MIIIYRVVLLIIIPLACLLIGEPSINAQEEALGLGEYNFQVSQNQWKTFKMAPCNNCLWKVESSNPFRVRFDDRREFQKLPISKDFRLPNGNVINTDVLEIVGKKHIPVESWGPMPSRFFYLRAESGTTHIHLVIKQSDSSAVSQKQEEEPMLGIRIGKGIINFLGWGIMKYLTSCCCVVLVIYAFIQIYNK